MTGLFVKDFTFPITPREEGNIYYINIKFIRQNCDGGKSKLPTLIIIDEAHLLEDVDIATQSSLHWLI